MEQTEGDNNDAASSIPGLGFETENKTEEPNEGVEPRTEAILAQDLEGFDTRSEASSTDDTDSSSLSDVSGGHSGIET